MLHDAHGAVQVIRVYICALGVELFVKLVFCVADQLQKAAAIPHDGAHIPGIHPGEAAGDGAENRLPLPLFFGQFVFQAEIIVGKLQPGPVAIPIHDAVFDGKGAVQHRVEKLPLVEFIFRQAGVGAKRAGGGAALDRLVAFAAQQQLLGAAKGLARRLVQIQQFVCGKVTHIDVAHVFIQHPFKVSGLFFQLADTRFCRLALGGEGGGLAGLRRPLCVVLLLHDDSP